MTTLRNIPTDLYLLGQTAGFFIQTIGREGLCQSCVKSKFLIYPIFLNSPDKPMGLEICLDCIRLMNQRERERKEAEELLETQKKQKDVVDTILP